MSKKSEISDKPVDTEAFRKLVDQFNGQYRLIVKIPRSDDFKIPESIRKHVEEFAKDALLNRFPDAPENRT